MDEQSDKRPCIEHSARNGSPLAHSRCDSDVSFEEQWSRKPESLTCLLSPIPRNYKSPRSKTPGRVKFADGYGKQDSNASFEHNQSLPCFSHNLPKRKNLQLAGNFQQTFPLGKTITMERLRGDGLLGCRFSAGRSRGSFSAHCPDMTALKRSAAAFLASQETMAQSMSMGAAGAAGDRSPPSRSLKSTNTTSFNSASATAGASASHNSSTTVEGDNSWARCAVPWAPLESMATTTHSGISLHRSVMLNPNKAVFTFDIKTMQILVVNEIACRLLGYSPQELTALKLVDLLHRPHSQSVLALGEEHIDTAEGSTLGLSGKVVEMVSREGVIVPVSLWLRSLPTEDRCLAVAEPVERRVAKIEIDSCGRILSADEETMTLFQYKKEEIEGEDLTTLIPAFTMPSSHDYLSSEIRKQKATGRTKYGVTFPLCLRLREIPENEEPDADLTSNSSISLVTYSVVIWVFSNMSGLIVLSLEGNIDQCNHHFANILFGHPQNKLVGKHITTVIPKFACDTEYQGDDTLMIPPTVQLGGEGDGQDDQLMQAALDSDSTTPQAFQASKALRSNGDSDSRSTNILSLDKSTLGESYRMCSSLTELTDLANRLNLTLDDDTTSASLQNDVQLSTAANNPGNATNATNGSCSATRVKEHNSDSKDDKSDCLNGNSTKNVKNQSTCTTDLMFSCTSHTIEQQADDDTSAATISGSDLQELQAYSQLLTAVDASVASATSVTSALSGFKEGYYIGYARHRDGSDIEIAYLVKLVALRCGRKMYCVWISRNSEDLREDGQGRALLDNLTLASSFNSTTLEQTFGHSASRPSSLSLHSQCEDELVAGEYSQHYTTLEQIGKGAYGYVKMAFRNQDGLLVITKFIHKQKVHQQCWVEDAKLRRRVPLEISLLSTVRHPNIVQVLDVFENPTFFQMVMQKHGAGMDLFDFVDRTPKLDEPLISYIFRQIVAAVAYLHSLQILHRDIKDENVIIDQYFRVKLIDFGSATFMSPDRLFSTFYGTMEYCSPEVLAGNKYEGPELEVWSLGVTLYVLTFGENPFFDVEETMRAELHPPEKASADLLDLLHGMLERNPARRCTVPELTEHPWINQPVDPTAYNFDELVNCAQPEWQPHTYYADYRQSCPLSDSMLGMTANNTANDDDNLDDNLDDENDHTDLASSNSLTSLTPVDDILLNSSTHGDHERNAAVESPEPPGAPPSSCSRGPVTSTPFKIRRPSQLSSSSSSSTAGADAVPEVATSTSIASSLSSNSSRNSSPCHCPHLSTSRSSASESPSSSTSPSSASCSDFAALSSSKHEPDSLAQALLTDFSDRAPSGAALGAAMGAALSISPLPMSEPAHTDAADELSDDDFEPVESDQDKN